MTLYIKGFALALSALITLPLAADEDVLLYFYEPGLSLEHQETFSRMVNHANNAEFARARTHSERLIAAHEAAEEHNRELYGKLLINHGIIDSADFAYEQGLASINDGLRHLEHKQNPFTTDLLRGLMAKAISEFSMDLTEDAEDTFRRAQHIVHRNQGVYSSGQLAVISWLTKTNLKRGEVLAADREQRFTLRVAEQAFGAESVDMIPFLNSLGAYFASRGSTIPPLMPSGARLQRDLLFRRSVNLYQRAVDIIEANFGEDDIRLVKPLRGLANARLLQITNRKYAEAALTRSFGIIDSHPGSDLTDKAQAMIDLGDFYTITMDTRAAPLYLQAWNLLQEDPQTRDLAMQLFDIPARLFPRSSPTLFLDRRPDAAEEDEDLYVKLEYAVTSVGKVKSVKVLEKNVPNEQVRILRYGLRNAIFRPRIEEGNLVNTEGLVLYQPFEVFRKVNNSQPSPVDNGLLGSPESAPHKQMAR